MKYVFRRDSPHENAYCIVGNDKYSIRDYRGDVFNYKAYGPYKYALVYQQFLPHQELDFSDIEQYNQWCQKNDLTDYFYVNHGMLTEYLLYNKNKINKHLNLSRQALWKVTIETVNKFIKDANDEIIDINTEKKLKVVQLHPVKLIQDDFLLYKDCLDFAQNYLNKRYPENIQEQLRLF